MCVSIMIFLVGGRGRGAELFTGTLVHTHLPAIQSNIQSSVPTSLWLLECLVQVGSSQQWLFGFASLFIFQESISPVTSLLWGTQENTLILSLFLFFLLWAQEHDLQALCTLAFKLEFCNTDTFFFYHIHQASLCETASSLWVHHIQKDSNCAVFSNSWANEQAVPILILPRIWLS